MKLTATIGTQLLAYRRGGGLVRSHTKSHASTDPSPLCAPVVQKRMAPPLQRGDDDRCETELR